MVFDRGAERFFEGDWVRALDADEFYHGAAGVCAWAGGACEGRCMRKCTDLVDAGRGEGLGGGRETLADRARPIEEPRRRFVVQEFPDPFRFRAG